MLRGDISREEFSEKLGDVTERCLARYVSGKSHLQECDFKLRGISDGRARQLMVCAAYTWARSEKIDLCDKSVPFKK